MPGEEARSDTPQFKKLGFSAVSEPLIMARSTSSVFVTSYRTSNLVTVVSSSEVVV